MTEDTIRWYIEYIERELKRLKDGHFTGNVDFKLNWKEGNCANMNVVLTKSVRQLEETNTAKNI